MKTVILKTILIAFGMCFINSFQSYAIDTDIFSSQPDSQGEMSDPHGSVGAAMEFSINHAPRMLVGFKYRGLNQNGPVGEAYKLFWVEGTFGFTKDDSTGTVVPYYKLKLNPFTKVYNELDNENTEFDLHITNLDIYKDIDQGVEGITIKAFQLEGSIHGKAPIFNYSHFVIDALGYVWAKDTELEKSFDGVYIVGFKLSMGHEWILSQTTTLDWTVLNMGVEASTKLIKANVYSELALKFKNAYSEWSLFVQSGGRFYNIGTDPFNNNAVNAGTTRDSSDGYIMFGTSGNW